jgi:hypothetical protein
MGDVIQYKISGKALFYTLHSQFYSKAQHDMHGDVVRVGGVLMGNFVRTTPRGTGKWQRVPMCDAKAINKHSEDGQA